MQPPSPSFILPHPLPFTLTVELPLDMEAECGGQGLPGFKCAVFLSHCLLTEIPLQNTLPLPAARTIPEQWGESASPTLVTALPIFQILPIF